MGTAGSFSKVLQQVFTEMRTKWSSLCPPHPLPPTSQYQRAEGSDFIYIDFNWWTSRYEEEMDIVFNSKSFDTRENTFMTVQENPCVRERRVLTWALPSTRASGEIGLRGISLVAQWLSICLPMQGTWVRALVREYPTCHGATKPVRHHYWACAVEPTSHNYWAHVPQLLKPARLEPTLRNKRSHRNEKPAHHSKE